MDSIDYPKILCYLLASCLTAIMAASIYFGLRNVYYFNKIKLSKKELFVIDLMNIKLYPFSLKKKDIYIINWKSLQGLRATIKNNEVYTIHKDLLNDN